MSIKLPGDKNNRHVQSGKLKVYWYVWLVECNSQFLLLLRGRHQRHHPAHKSHNLARAVWLILSVHQQKQSADTVESQRTA